MCSNGCWVNMGGLGGFTCDNGQMSKRAVLARAFRA
jgi:hypothetical protein